MLEEVKQSITPHLEGILRDSQTLLRQELALARSEVREEVRNARDIAIGLAAGWALGGLAALFLLTTLALGIVWLFPDLPMFAGFGLVGLGLAGAAAVFLLRARAVAKEADLAPVQTIDSLKENAKWIAQKL